MTPTFSGECQIVAWADSNARGPTVTFRLQSSEDLEAFRGVTLAKKGMAGDRFAVVAVLIHDDETLDGDDSGLPNPLETITARDLVDAIYKPQTQILPQEPGETIEILPAPGEGKTWWQQADGTFKIIDVPNGQPDKPDAPAPAPKPAVGHFPNGLTGLSVRWCLLPDFWQWLETEYGIPVADESTAKDLVCSLCYCQSRKELNDDPVAAANFEEMVKVPYSESRRARGLDA